MTVRVRARSYLSVKDFTAEETWDVLRTAESLKRARERGLAHAQLPGKTLAMIFQKPSLRTRVSFETAMTQLGGHAIVLAPEDIRLGQRETVEDVALTLSRMADVIMARVFEHRLVEELARHATVPVINALSDREHPCQILGDLLTLVEHKRRLQGLRMVFCGDGNNVAHSLLYGAALTGMNLTVVTPKGYEPSPEIFDEASRLGRSRNAVLRVEHDPGRACEGADVVYTDVWTSMGQESEGGERRAAFRGFTVDDALMARARPDALLMHCLPAHYGEEIDYATSRGPHSVLFDQAENRLHAQKGLLVTLAG